MVDLACACPGVIGAQLAGAGLGGCMMMLVRAESLSGLMRRLREDYYRARGISCDAYVCRPVAGAGLLQL
jgi:N-acetylgalactosamine kinase